MDKLYEYLKSTFVSFKLSSCCCIAPIRLGLLVTGYFNIFIALLSLVGTADDGYTPPLMAVQAIILEDDFSKPLGIVAYATEMAFNMLLLAGIYRNDISLLRVYMYFVVGSIVCSVLVYSIVFALISLLIKTLIILILAFQCYVIVLVRSVIVEIKETRTSEKNGHVTLYSVVRMPDDVPAKPDNLPTDEAAAESNGSKNIASKTEIVEEETSRDLKLEQNKDEPTTKLETINEQLKEN